VRRRGDHFVSTRRHVRAQPEMSPNVGPRWTTASISRTRQYGIEAGKPANFLVLNADPPSSAVRQRADVLASIRNGEYLFKRPEPSYEVELDLFRKTK
jgi:hypothetical protein